MAISEKILNRTQTAIQAIRDSRLPAGEQDDLIEMVCDARDGTNGLSDHDKLQANSDNIASLVFMFVRQSVSRPERPTTWKDVCIRCRREIAAIVGLAIVAIIYVVKVHPELVQYLSLLRH